MLRLHTWKTPNGRKISIALEELGIPYEVRPVDLSKNEQLTLPVGIQRFFSENTTDFPGLMAASFMMSVPVVVLFLVLQRYFVRALTEGAVKH